MYSPSSPLIVGRVSEREVLDEGVNETVVRDLLANTQSKYEEVRAPAEQQLILLERYSGFCAILLVR